MSEDGASSVWFLREPRARRARCHRASPFSVSLLRLAADGCSRPSALLRDCPGLSAKVMNERLHKMMRFGIVQCSVCGEKPPLEVEFVLTSFGRRFIELLDGVRRLQEAVDNGSIVDQSRSA
jgi:DNA-binding HxlR family transcriptional regulator